MQILLLNSKDMIGDIELSNKAVNVALFGIVLLIFLLYFVTIHTVLPSGEPIKGQLQSLIDYAGEEKWEDAQNSLEDLNKTWNRIKFLIALNYGEADYPIFLEYLGRLKTAVKTRDASQVTTDAAAALALWKNFIKVIPEP